MDVVRDGAQLLDARVDLGCLAWSLQGRTCADYEHRRLANPVRRRGQDVLCPFQPLQLKVRWREVLPSSRRINVVTQRAARNGFLEGGIKTNLRRATYKTARLASYHPFGHKPADFLWFHPSPRNTQELADLSARVNWYLPSCKVPVYVGRSVETAISPSDAPYMDPALVRNPGWAQSRPRGTAEHVYWKMKPSLAYHFLAHCRRADIADATWFWVSDRGWTRLAERYSPVPEPSSAAVERLLDLRVQGGSAFVLGTGPSATMIDLATVDAEIRIACNSAVRNRELLERYRPQILCFGDPVFHCGPSVYAATFRRDMIKAVRDYDLLVVSTSDWATLLLANEPELVERLVVLRSDPGVPYRLPDTTDVRVRRTMNILTIAMLPVAGALADVIEIAGCDGRKPDEDYFWQHNRQVQYTDELMRTAFDAHPSFFRDVSYGGHYGLHTEHLEDVCTFLESLGKQIKPVTPSWIPALSRRDAPPFPEAQPARNAN